MNWRHAWIRRNDPKLIYSSKGFRVIGLIQRVHSASVMVNSEIVGEIDTGILLFLGVEKNDHESIAKRLVNRVINYRIFADAAGKMNHSLLDSKGAILIVPQFTLAADTGKGLRPSFTPAATPEKGKALFNRFVDDALHYKCKVQTGVFGADMQVALVNNGPATFVLEVR